MQNASIGVFGASGYSGVELTRLLARHPHARLTFATSDRWVGQTLGEKARLAGPAAALAYCSVEQGLERAKSCDVVCLATPAESSLELAPKLLALGVRAQQLEQLQSVAELPGNDVIAKQRRTA